MATELANGLPVEGGKGETWALLGVCIALCWLVSPDGPSNMSPAFPHSRGGRPLPLCRPNLWKLIEGKGIPDGGNHPAKALPHLGPALIRVWAAEREHRASIHRLNPVYLLLI